MAPSTAGIRNSSVGGATGPDFVVYARHLVPEVVHMWSCTWPLQWYHLHAVWGRSKVGNLLDDQPISNMHFKHSYFKINRCILNVPVFLSCAELLDPTEKGWFSVLKRETLLLLTGTSGCSSCSPFLKCHSEAPIVIFSLQFNHLVDPTPCDFPQSILERWFGVFIGCDLSNNYLILWKLKSPVFSPMRNQMNLWANVLELNENKRAKKNNRNKWR